MLSATVNSAPANSVNRHMKKNYKCYFLAIACSLSVLTAYADEYVWGEPFKEGDTVSAETFNQIFDSWLVSIAGYSAIDVIIAVVIVHQHFRPKYIGSTTPKP